MPAERTEQDLSQPEVVAAVSAALRELGVGAGSDVAARAVLDAALAAVPDPQTVRDRAAAAALARTAAAEQSLPEPARSRTRAIRVALTALDAVEGRGSDSSAVLSGSGLDGVHPLAEPVLRGARAVDWYRMPAGGPEAFSPHTWGPEIVSEILDTAARSADRAWLRAEADRAAESEAELREQARQFWDSGDWAALYPPLAAILLSNVLHPAVMDDEDWEDYLGSDLDDLRASQDEVLGRLLPGDLEAAGIARTPDGRWTAVGD